MKILQWNCWYKEDVGSVLSVIKKMNVDVICLQELTVNHPHYNISLHTAEIIARELGFYYTFREAQIKRSEEKEMSYGNGIFSRYPIISSSFHYIQDPQDSLKYELDYSKEGRVYVEATIDEHGMEWCIGTTHMSYTDRFVSTIEKKKETDILMEILKKKKHHFIFTGDLNAVPGSYTVEQILGVLKNAGPDIKEKTWTTKPFSYKGFEAHTLEWRIDYCFTTHDVNVKSSAILKTDCSDHLPIILEI